MGRFRSLGTNLGVALAAAAVGFACVYGFSANERFIDQARAMVSGECVIKGNVSIGSGERIYHVPGQRYYEETIIRPEFGERWFCSEADARAAGWRRSGI